MARQQVIAIVAAALLAALIGLALLLALQAARADALLAQTYASVARSGMHISTVSEVMSAGSRAAHTFLSK